jgi:hypothetical protein
VAAFATNFALFGVAPHRRCLIVQPIDPSGQPRRCPDADIDHSDEALSTNLVRAQVITGGLFFAAAIWGVVDALRHHQDDVLITPTPGGVAAAWRF